MDVKGFIMTRLSELLIEQIEQPFLTWDHVLDFMEKQLRVRHGRTEEDNITLLVRCYAEALAFVVGGKAESMNWQSIKSEVTLPEGGTLQFSWTTIRDRNMFKVAVKQSESPTTKRTYPVAREVHIGKKGYGLLRKKPEMVITEIQKHLVAEAKIQFEHEKALSHTDTYNQKTVLTELKQLESIFPGSLTESADTLYRRFDIPQQAIPIINDEGAHAIKIARSCNANFMIQLKIDRFHSAFQNVLMMVIDLSNHLTHAKGNIFSISITCDSLQHVISVSKQLKHALGENVTTEQAA
jgi:hypothetical protein